MKNKILIILTMLVCLLLSQVSAQNTQLIPMERGRDKWGYVNSKGKKVIDFKYRRANHFNSLAGLAIVQTLDGKWGCIDITGKEVVPCKYNNIYDFSEGLAVVVLDGKRGYVDTYGKEIVPCKYDQIDKFIYGSAKVQLDGKWGYVEKTGKEIIPCKYDKISDYQDSWRTGKLYRYMVELDGKKGGFDETGKEVIPCKYDEIEFFEDRENRNKPSEFAKVISEKKWGYIDKTGKEVIPCKYDWIGKFSETLKELKELAKVQLDAKKGYIDKTGKEVIACKYDSIGIFSRELDGLKVQLDGKWGYIDMTDKEVIPCKYDNINYWSSGETVNIEVWADGKIGKIDRNGKETVALKYKSRQTQDIWENILIPQRQQIITYIAKNIRRISIENNSTSGTFTIKRPYLIVSTETGKAAYEIEFSKYSENNFSVKNVKTLVVNVKYYSNSVTYRYSNNEEGVGRYGSILLYFDVEGKEFIGFDKLPPPAAPNALPREQRSIENSIFKIIEKIETRLTTPAK